MGRQVPPSNDFPTFFTGLGLAKMPDYSTPDDSKQHGSTMDCDSKHKHEHKHDDNTNDNKIVSGSSIDPNSNEPNPTSTTGLPTIARRRFRSPIRRDPDNNSIFERDVPSSTTTAGKPTTVGDIVAQYLQQKTASRKRAMRPRTSRGAN